ncbi:sensor histidine kinase [Lysobacter yangpyeongensis]|uniref:histidine kinase n=1 Tax=Lysobacter yangpyeongensis TaxID=346182 RepID=A0ABW0SN39_9GAMM
MATRPAVAAEADSALRRELHFFTLYRLLEAALLTFLLFSPIREYISEPRDEGVAKATAVSSLFVALVLFVIRRRGELQLQALVGVAFDLFFGILAVYAMPGTRAGIVLMLMFNVGAAALLLPTRLGVGIAGIAACGLLVEYFLSIDGNPDVHGIGEPLMFATGYLAVATLTNILGRQMRESVDLAEQRGADAASLAEVNELIIRRLRTGVLLVDGRNHLRLANEAAMLLLSDTGSHPGEGRDLLLAAPALARRLAAWRETGRADDSPLQLAMDLPEVVPRFTRLRAGSEQVLIFLDDTSIVSRQAESMTLATLGRFSASLAHEIRNPLAAINYAVQLLEESKDLPTADQRLLEIVREQGKRMNGIVDNVLGLARRDSAKPEHVELMSFTRRFVEEYAASHPLEQDTVRVAGTPTAVNTLIDPRQLHQVLTALVYNALTYGRMPGQPAQVTVRVSVDDSGAPIIDVRDRGPGVPESVVSQLFRPFFTTSGHGTGLGLYIARELCRANQASLEYVAMPGGGACFRIGLPTPSPLMGGHA